MKYCLAILANNLFFVDYLLRFFPKKYQDIDILFVNEVRVGDRREQLRMLTKKYDNPNFKNIRIISSIEVLKWFIKKAGFKNKFLLRYLIGMNIMAEPYLLQEYDKVLYCDDDVIILNDNLLELFEYDFVFSSHIFNRFEKESETFREFNRIFESNFTVEEYDSHIINSGVRIYSKSPDYIRWLTNFFKSSFLYNKYMYSIARITAGRLLDQVYENFLALKFGDRVVYGGSDFCRVYCYKKHIFSDKMRITPVIYHYAVGNKMSCVRSFAKILKRNKYENPKTKDVYKFEL